MTVFLFWSAVYFSSKVSSMTFALATCRMHDCDESIVSIDACPPSVPLPTRVPHPVLRFSLSLSLSLSACGADGDDDFAAIFWFAVSPSTPPPFKRSSQLNFKSSQKSKKHTKQTWIHVIAFFSFHYHFYQTVLLFGPWMPFHFMSKVNYFLLLLVVFLFWKIDPQGEWTFSAQFRWMDVLCTCACSCSFSSEKSSPVPWKFSVFQGNWCLFPSNHNIYKRFIQVNRPRILSKVALSQILVLLGDPPSSFTQTVKRGAQYFKIPWVQWGTANSKCLFLIFVQISEFWIIFY